MQAYWLLWEHSVCSVGLCVCLFIYIYIYHILKHEISEGNVDIESCFRWKMDYTGFLWLKNIEGIKTVQFSPFLHLFTWKRCQLKIVDESSSADYSRQSVSCTYVHFPSQLEFSLIIMYEYRIPSEKYWIDVPPNQNLTLSCLSFLILVFPFF